MRGRSVTTHTREVQKPDAVQCLKQRARDKGPSNEKLYFISLLNFYLKYPDSSVATPP